MTILDQKLHRQILRLRITHLAGQTLRPHNRRREHNGDVQPRHQIVRLPLHHPREMEDQKLERVSVARGHDVGVVDGGAHDFDAGGRLGGVGGVEEAVVDFVGDERGGEAAEELFEGRGDGVDVEVRVGDVEVVVPFEAFADELDLGVAAGFAVDAFDVHACGGGGFGSQNLTGGFWVMLMG